MSGTASAKLKAGTTGQSEPDLFNAKERIRSSHTSELVIALCGPIGSPLVKVAEAIKARLLSEFNYSRCEIIKLSKLIEDHAGGILRDNKFQRTQALIQKGDDLRAKHGAGVLAELAVSQIVLDRQKHAPKPDGQLNEPRRVCHIIDSIKNQEELDVLKLVYRDMLYFLGVFAPLPARVKSLEKGGMTQAQIFELIDVDSGEELPHGQTVRDTFPQADFFLRVDADTDAQIRARVQRFLSLILGTKVLTPTSAETAMYMAASAAGNSACLSRQVGAALTDERGEILSVGWNDVPKFGGGLYVADLKDDANADRDRRCYNIDDGVCFNDREKRTISELIVGQLAHDGLIADDKKEQAIASIIGNTKVKDLIEFSRSIHAEMHAMLGAAHLSGARMKGGKLFCTTYPCHSCARHIIAAGIKEVYYIEPYRKSLATKLHDDAITEDESDAVRVRILPYDGVAPTRYLKLFRVPASSRKAKGKMIQVDPREAAPRFDKTLLALPTLEALIVKGLQDKKLIPVDAVQ